jgi:FkbM family methyltransferase
MATGSIVTFTGFDNVEPLNNYLVSADNLVEARYCYSMYTTTEQDIVACFRLLLGRTLHEEERNHFLFVGQPLDSVVSSYLQSLEFRHRGLLTPSRETTKIACKGYTAYVAADDPLIGAGIGGDYEPEVTQAFLDHMGDGVVIDIGANCGYFSLLARSRGADVWAFEPLQRNLQLLQATIAENRLDRIHIMAAAASDSPGTLVIGASYTNGIVTDELLTTPAAALQADYVAAVRIDDVIPAQTKVSLIKIDVEGYEYRALMGARKTIERSRPVIISEFAPSALSVSSRRSGVEYLELLRNFGYHVSVIGAPELDTTEAILESVKGIDHINILATYAPRMRLRSIFGRLRKSSPPKHRQSKA